MKYDRVRIICLTGGIGSGKSTVSRYLSGKGNIVIDADKIAREIVKPGSPVLKKLSAQFGEEIITDCGCLDRKKLADIVFKKSALREIMDCIMHGEILKIIKGRIAELIESDYKGLIILDIPLLFETEMDKLIEHDEIWLVDAERDIRIERIIKRDGSSRDDILRRMDNQMSSEEKKKKAQIIIDNSGCENDLYVILGKLIEKYES